MITAILIEIFSNLNFWFEQSSAAAEANQIQAYSRAALHYLGDVKKILAAHYLPKYIVGLLNFSKLWGLSVWFMW